MKLGFDCVFYYVSDIDRAIRFYTNVLGFPVTSQDFVTRFDVDGMLFELVPTTDKSKLSGGGNARLCLEVDSIGKTVQELQEKGVRTTGTREETGGVLASFFDPDGNEICLWEYSRRT